ncbi:MAG: winged helix-turn-helix transcriptional regulator [Promethearchaeota archaeon]|nr:MAG: winged helix-turn-helix transcriptional regulator [Candidatus Lokiarchaeota archaeon]
MDQIDFTICLMLVWNSRTPYRELAETFKMSVNSIHKRVKAMVNLGILDKFVTTLSLRAFKPIPSNVVMFGVSKTKNVKGLIEKLGANENIYTISQHSGNLFIIHAYIRNLSDLKPLVSFIKQTAEIAELKVGLDSSPMQPEAEVDMTKIDMTRDVKLSTTDFLIINALKDNSRKSVVEIAEEVEVSTKTVRRHLDRLIENHLIDFSIHWYPDKCSEVTTMIILTLKPTIDADKTEIIKSLRYKYGQKILFTWTFSTLPNTIVVCIWVSSMKELQDIRTSLISDNFESVSLNIGIEGKIFPTWREKYLEDKIKEIRGKTA